ncbi:hypothetical protein C7T94_02555 [Pedobacter yulinensis]|uniref:histidine kinase n=1 Tax=Pedobacter yulinensis TaxID=2126353 RepID=A0A2T3HRC3_9SPHI|nr:histidine kinase dimerization/phospho-acceptor domain-containing protein [Pedobacter yulinensis]PST85015.1 hypothetical protein C7T94_02555 [Pedobacter yulinensis]
MNIREARARNAKRYAEVQLTSDGHLQDLVELAATACQAPIAWFCLAGEGNPQVVCSTGISQDQIVPVDSFLHGMEGDSRLTFANFTARNPQFKDHRLVCGPAAVRFFAGIPVRFATAAYSGYLFVMDTRSRSLTSREERALFAVSEQISRLLDLHADVKTLRDDNDAISHARMALYAIYETDRRFHVLLDHDQRILDHNVLFEDFVSNRYGQKLRRGHLFTQLIDSDCLPEFIEGFIGAINGALVQQHPGTFFKADKPDTWREITYAPVKNYKGRVVGVSYTAIDIRERVKRDEQLSVQKQLLHTIAEMQSHQIRKPVASIIGLLELMKMEEGSANKEYLELMSRSINELDRKIRDIVDHSSGKGPTSET